MQEEDFDIRQRQIKENEKDIEKALRPLEFDDFNGQEGIISNLRINALSFNIYLLNSAVVVAPITLIVPLAK